MTKNYYTPSNGYEHTLWLMDITQFVRASLWSPFEYHANDSIISNES